MSDGSSIGWLQMPGHKPASWNPLRAYAVGGSLEHEGRRGWACERVSPGCQNCYAEAINLHMGTRELYRVEAPIEHFLDVKTLREPLDKWSGPRSKPRCAFVCSMTDLFGAWVPTQRINDILRVILETPQHTYVVLTKRAPRMRDHLRSFDPRANLIVGVSVENQEFADKRMPSLVELAEAGWRTVASYEPALGPVDWSPWLRALGPRSWFIVGAESGKGRRGFNPFWIPAAECAEAGVPLFVKQGSAFRPGEQAGIPDHLWALKQFPGAW